MRKEWLKNKISVEEAERKYMTTFSLLTKAEIPFGHINQQWQALLAKKEAGDELFEFRSPEHTWRGLGGRAGISLVRDGEIVDSIITALN